MSKETNSCLCSSGNVLVPVTIMALTLVITFGYQMGQILSDRNRLVAMDQQLSEPFAQSKKLNDQFGGLVRGTNLLAQEGNETAKQLASRLIELGILTAPSEALKQPAKPPVPIDTQKKEEAVKP
ncbi:MAG: hypothetical protein EOM37_00935 [Proteobacteria bacterium]|nr:hypothetical protein [Alphaproteobacteria bacterium]NCC02605.1 hypothetical protein [Pseudomonadota bacterium]